ncbi:hypothetical protein L4174_008410 [Photobacterium sp. CCB-ST2H9]|uniref:hypothetical protein n=1 Tax=Photobacterium sp. CCB-ST2H9 TaxID=2912855 RepID=UPI002004E478|nr:hypothetical protein [Photobacterium sp. CCB-ST2H9]UTM55890.1 hypothetical protein L4174_008410 [Photobacterium sp. CCB-ST2H9]
MNNKSLQVGGSIEKATSGTADLQAIAVLQEAWKVTAKHFLTFFPAIAGLFLAQLALLLVALKVQLGNPGIFFDAFITGEGLTPDILEAGFMANFWSDVLSAPLYAGVSLMALNHAVGLPTKPRYLVKGFPFAVVSVVTMLLTSSLQGIGSALFPLIGLFLTMAFSMTITLVCEKRVTPMKAIQYSVVATFRKILPMSAIFLAVLILFFLSFATAGIGLIWTIPFFFNVKAIVYRNLFGITLQVTTVRKGDNGDDNNNQGKEEETKVFDA